MDPESGILRESAFFEARKATSASSSSSYYSSRIHTLMKLKSEGGMSEKDAEIEASKTHWTEVESNRYYTPATSGTEKSSTSETTGESSGVTGGESSGVTGGESCGEGMTEEGWAELYKENVEEMRRLLMEKTQIHFFAIGGKVEGEMIAKGGQATIYEHWYEVERKTIPMVMKVFEAGYSVRELRKQWPVDLLHRSRLSANYLGRLLDDGRFAFEMGRYWGDIRKLLDVRMQHNGNRNPPFMMEDGSYQEVCIFQMWSQIAMQMESLHDEGILHRDLKASNVLIDCRRDLKEEAQLNPIELGANFICRVADYECSIGVVGTGFWRAPEILEALKNRTLHNSPSLFTPKVDIYSYTMTCYEILTGFVPFEHPEDEGTNVDHVLQGKRPTLPQHLKPWVIELFQRCWDVEPSSRPTFLEIVTILENVRDDPLFLKDLAWLE